MLPDILGRPVSWSALRALKKYHLKSFQSPTTVGKMAPGHHHVADSDLFTVMNRLSKFLISDFNADSPKVSARRKKPELKDLPYGKSVLPGIRGKQRYRS